MAILLMGATSPRTRCRPSRTRSSAAGTSLTDGTAIIRGQDVYQRYGLMDHGSVWGHGSLRGHGLLGPHAALRGRPGEAVSWPPRGSRPADAYAEACRRSRVASWTNWTPRSSRRSAPTATTRQSKTLELTPAQAYAFEQMRQYWEQEFAQGDAHYGFLKDTVPTAEERKDLADFFFWTAWAAGTNRPGLNYSYTNNWPSGPLGGQHGLDRGAGLEPRVDHGLVRRAWASWSTSSTATGSSTAKSKAVAGGLPAPGDAGDAQPAGQRQVLPRRRAAVRGADLQRRPAGPLHGPPRQLLRRSSSARCIRTVGPRAGTCNWRFSGSPSPGWARPSTWRRWSAGASRRPAAAGQHPLRRGRGRDRGEPAGRGPGHQGLPGATPGSGSATRAGSTSNWAGSGRSCSSAG